MNHFFNKIRSLAEHPAFKRGVFFVAVLMLIAAALVWVWLIWKFNHPAASEKIAPSPEIVYRAIDGVETELGEYQPTFAVVIDNHPDSRPQIGTAAAPLVYEVPVEGGMTRLLAMFPLEAVPVKIGPVRSLRPYMTDLAAAYNAVLMHVGGSPEALRLVKTASVLDVNEFYRGWYFFRDSSRARPHNVESTFELMKKILDEQKVLVPAKFASWSYVDAAEITGVTLENGIKIPFGALTAGWEYEPAREKFGRTVDGALESDASGTRLEAANVIVMLVKSKVIDNEGRLKVQIISDGEAVIFSAGKMRKGKWIKQSAETREQFVDEKGVPISLARGATWVEVVPADLNIDFTLNQE